MIAPIGNFADEVVRGRVDRLDRDVAVGCQLHEREAFGLRSSETDEIDVLGRTPRREPTRGSCATDQQPFAGQLAAGTLEKVPHSGSIEAHIGHMLTLGRMTAPWQLLRDGGVPLAIEGTGARPEASVLAQSARAAIALAPQGRDAESLGAWIVAWRDHWPTSFKACFAHDTDAVSEWAERNTPDAGRRVKLRRIAIENLATIL